MAESLICSGAPATLMMLLSNYVINEAIQGLKLYPAFVDLRMMEPTE